MYMYEPLESEHDTGEDKWQLDKVPFSMNCLAT